MRAFLLYAADSVHCGSNELARPQLKQHIVLKPARKPSAKEDYDYE